MAAVDLVQLWRGGLLESTHQGHVVVADAKGIVAAWGDPETVIFPRSSCKMMQALPLIESGAADAAGLGADRLALACASHQGAALHRDAVARWLGDLGLGEADLRCGAHMPRDKDEAKRLTCSDESPCQLHNNCSGKHAGFLTLNRHLKGDADYHLIDHPVQRAVKEAFEEVTAETSPGYGIDGCSAPNFATSVAGLARAMAAFANPQAAGIGGVRAQAMTRLTQAMVTHPDLVAGEGRACTKLMRAAKGQAAVKTGAEAVFVGILPQKGLGIALKISDGGTRGSEAAITALLAHLGVLNPADPLVTEYAHAPQVNWNGINTGELRLAPGFPG
ncbi:MAG: asparaginase [Paracoccus sp. (in: a-proteobacteria)]|uniref:asparaginase n=1 Tax=Paracoccus sp. TaxID=267 RepID=UPI0026DEBBD6|nr:asparaginase [Paracoccus sp. (in: a-proteobacteria)]MDO5622853.1 asparaginase [Paracoccus sp. (in: a-proteobacteria)]